MDLGSLLKSLFVPLIISAILYAVIFFVLLPLYRQHRARYAQYLPVSLAQSETILPNNLRNRMADALISFISTLPFTLSSFGSRRAGRMSRNRVVDGRDDLDDDGEHSDGDEELEEAVWDGNDRSTRHIHIGSNHRMPPLRDDRRLSRDLEEGFRDSTDEEGEES